MTDINTQVDIDPNTADDPNILSNTETNAGTRNAGTEDEPQDIRSLLNKAVAGELKTDEAGRVRAPDGKFASKQTETPPESNTQVASDSNTPPVQQQQEYKPNLEPAEQEAINLVPEANRAALLKAFQVREAAFYNAQGAANELLNRARGYESIEKIVGPRREQLALQGASVEQWLTQVSTLSDFADKRPAEFIQWYASQRGLDLKQLAEDFIPPDPHLQALHSELAQLRQQVGHSQNFQQNQVVSSMVDQVASFADAKDATGAPLRPYYNEVQNDLLMFIPALKAQNPGLHPQQLLQEAYDRAVHANPNTRTRLAQMEESKRTAEAAQRAAKARTAGLSVHGGPSSGSTPTMPAIGDSVRDALNAAIAQHSG